MSEKPIHIFRHGPHSHRCPLSYGDLDHLWADHVESVPQANLADLYVFSHILDIQNAPKAWVLDWRARRRPVVLFSEEPFWDTIWGKQPLDRDMFVATNYGDVPVIQLNHGTSDIFSYDKIPYYLLTNHRFANTYAARFLRNALLSPEEWQRRFQRCPLDMTFMFERRPEPYHAVEWADAELIGLCSWRTEVAEKVRSEKVECLGKSWGNSTSRFGLRNWHLDKIVRLDGRARFMAALENTHQNTYVSEKFFDAFACGSIPVYFAGPNHKIFELDLPEDSWINLYGLTPDQAAARLQNVFITPEICEAYSVAQSRLADIFVVSDHWVNERKSLGHKVLQSLRMLAAL